MTAFNTLIQKARILGFRVLNPTTIIILRTITSIIIIIISLGLIGFRSMKSNILEAVWALFGVYLGEGSKGVRVL